MATRPIKPAVTGTTGTGLDALVSMISSDAGLNNNLARSEISAGAKAADGMNTLIVNAIRATGVANDGTLSTSDVYDVSAYIHTKNLSAWTAFHGDDENGVETGFHLVQSDGAQARMFGQNLIDTVADGIYHTGFEIQWGRFLNEDGNSNASVETVAYWLTEFLKSDLASGNLANANVDAYAHGTTGTGLDSLISTMAEDAGLNNRIATSQITNGLKAADGMNNIIVNAIRATGVANDGTLTTSDIYDVSSYIQTHNLAAWTAFHGDDENGVETGFHLIQGDGSTTRDYGENLIDTVADGLYHTGFDIQWGRFLNEDGNANATVQSVAYWLTDMLKNDLANGNLANNTVEAYASGTTGTGLDSLIATIAGDEGLNGRIATSEITAGLKAADGMNQIIVDAIRGTGVADDGSLSDVDVRDINTYIREHHLAEWTALHGDDEDGVETGFHLVQNDGAARELWGENAANTVADGLYHAGFEIKWDHFVNEDGNSNASVGQVAEWLSLLLKEDLASGNLDSNHAPVDPASLADDIAYQLTETLTVEARAGYREVGNVAGLALKEGTFALTFVADSPNDGDYNVLFSKDGSGYGDGGHITAWVSDGRLKVLLQSRNGEVTLSSGETRIEAGQAYDMAFTFGSEGAQLYLDGVKLDTAPEFTANLAGNSQSLVIGAGTWGRSASNPSWMWDHFDGTISNFTVYDKALDRHEVEAINTSGSLPGLTPGNASRGGELPAAYAGTGLTGEVYDRNASFSSINDLAKHIATTAAPSQTFDAKRIDFGTENDGAASLSQFIGSSGRMTSGGGNTTMETIGIKLSGYVWIPAGNHLVTVRSDDGFLLKIGGQTFSSESGGRGFEPTAKAAEFGGGLYKIELIYFENYGGEGLRFEIDGKTVGADSFYKSIADYDKALADKGPMPSNGLPDVDALPEGTTGTGLDDIAGVIASDPGLAARVDHDDLALAARAANIMTNLIVEAIRATDTASDGDITTSDMYDISSYIRLRHEEAWFLAHGDDEGDEETGFHLVQNDGSVTSLFGRNAIDTIADGIFHAAFPIKMGAFLNEDGNGNARVEQVAFWINELLADDFATGELDPSAFLAGVADMVESAASHVNAGRVTVSITLKGAALDATGNKLDNVITGNGNGNFLDGGDGDDRLEGGAGDDMLAGGRGGDTMIGGTGNDIYTIDSALDVIEEVADASGGIDTAYVFADLTTFRFADGLENLIYLGKTGLKVNGNAAANEIETNYGIDTVNGGDGNDVLSTGAAADSLTGGAGDDILDGGIGADSMSGGDGDDIFYVDNDSDAVIERTSQGTDTVYASIDYRLASNVERLYLTGMAAQAIGNALDNAIFGNDRANLINGGTGSDRLLGGRGDDIYISDGGDTIVELSDSGIDTVKSSATMTLAGNVERLVLTGTAAINGTGNNMDNTIAGNDAANVLTGGIGFDTLFGGEGADRFVYTSIADSTLVRGPDRIMDFNRAEGDRIDVSLIDANTSVAGDQAFTSLIGGNADFSAAGQYRFVKTSNGYQLEFNVDTDSKADMVIYMTTADAAAANWFIL